MRVECERASLGFKGRQGLFVFLQCSDGIKTLLGRRMLNCCRPESFMKREEVVERHRVCTRNAPRQSG